MKRKAKIGIGAGAALLVVIIAGVSAGAGDRGAVSVRIETADTRDLVSTVTASGWIRPRRAVEVQADIMGRIIELRVAEGDTVRRGELLLRIDPSQYEAAVSQAEAMVSTALAEEARSRASLLQAERALERARQMLQRDSLLVSRQMLEEAETQVRVQQAMHESAGHGVERSRAALREARDRLAKTVIRAPIDGVVTRLNVEEGEMAIVGTMNNPGSLLLTISDLSVMEAVVRVDETDVPELQYGDSAVIEIDAFPNRKFAGRITQIGHSSTTTRGSGSMMGQSAAQAVDFEVVITVENAPAMLRPDLSANAEIVTETRRGVLAVPIIALTVREKKKAEALDSESPAADSAGRALAAAGDEQQDEEGVYVVREGKAKFVPVKVGVTGQEHFEVLSGLSAKDSVVAGPYEAVRALTDDKPVRAMRAAEKDKKAGAAESSK